MLTVTRYVSTGKELAGIWCAYNHMCEDGPQLSDLSTMNLETADKEVAEGVLSGKVTEVVKNKQGRMHQSLVNILLQMTVTAKTQ